MNRESDGERAIRVALDDLGIHYEQEKKIDLLKNDTKNNRVADFFLPKYNLYIEYFGGWDKKNKSKRKRYREKRKVYKQNNIDCIYIYPKQLNYITYSLRKGLEKYSEWGNPLPIYKDLFMISILTGVIFILLLTQIPGPSLILLSINGVVSTTFYFTRCPNCKRVFAKEHVSSDVEKIEERPWRYRIEIRYLYLDGSFKNSNYSQWKKRTERIKIIKNQKECKYCGYRWTERKEKNLDKHSRPRTLIKKKTRYKNPNK